jgi:hypothetical protein
VPTEHPPSFPPLLDAGDVWGCTDPV